MNSADRDLSRTTMSLLQIANGGNNEAVGKYEDHARYISTNLQFHFLPTVISLAPRRKK